MSADNLASLVVREAGIREERLAEALRWQVMHGGQLDTALLEMGLLDEKTLLLLLAKAFGLASVGREVIDRVDKDTVAYFPRRLAEKYGVVPVSHEQGRLVVAVSHSPDFSLLEEISEVLQAHVQPVVTTELRMNYALYRLYGAPLMSRMENLLGLLGEDPEDIPTLAFFGEDETPRAPPRNIPTLSVAGRASTVPSAAAIAAGPPHGLVPSSMAPTFTAGGLGVATAMTASSTPVLVPTTPAKPADDLAARQRREAVRARLLARLEAEENAERQVEQERRMRRVSWTVDDAIAEIALAETRDAMLDIALRFAYRKLRTAAVFIIQRRPRSDGSKSPVFVGWDIIDPNLSREDIVRLTIPVDGEHVLGNLWLMRNHYLGPLRDDDPLQVAFGQAPRAAILVPILVGGHLIGALYGDGGERVVPPASLAELQMVVPRLGKALGNLIVRKRHAAAPPRETAPGFNSNGHAFAAPMPDVASWARTVQAGGGDAFATVHSAQVNPPVAAPNVPVASEKIQPADSHAARVEPFSTAPFLGAGEASHSASIAAARHTIDDEALGPEAPSHYEGTSLATLAPHAALSSPLAANASASATGFNGHAAWRQEIRGPSSAPNAFSDFPIEATRAPAEAAEATSGASLEPPKGNPAASNPQDPVLVESAGSFAAFSTPFDLVSTGPSGSESPSFDGATRALESTRAESSIPGTEDVEPTAEAASSAPDREAPVSSVAATDEASAAAALASERVGPGAYASVDTEPQAPAPSAEARAPTSGEARIERESAGGEDAEFTHTDMLAHETVPSAEASAPTSGEAHVEREPASEEGAALTASDTAPAMETMSEAESAAAHRSTSAFSLAPPSPRQPVTPSEEVEAAPSADAVPNPQEAATASALSLAARTPGDVSTELVPAQAYALHVDVDVELDDNRTTPAPDDSHIAAQDSDDDDLDVELAQDHLALQESVPEIDDALERIQASSSGSFFARTSPQMEPGVANAAALGVEDGQQPIGAGADDVALDTPQEVPGGSVAPPSSAAQAPRGDGGGGPPSASPATTNHDLTAASDMHHEAERVAPSSEAPVEEESIALDLEALSAFDPLRRFARESALSPPILQRQTPSLLPGVNGAPAGAAAAQAGTVGDAVAAAPAGSASPEVNPKPSFQAAPALSRSVADTSSAHLYPSIPASPGEDARESTLLQTWRAWLEASDAEADHRVRALEGAGATSEEICAWVCALQERSAAALARTFPGKLTMHPFGAAAARPNVSELSAVCACLVELGPTLAAPILVGELAHDDRMHRFAAVWCLSELYVPAAVPSLAQRLFDREMRIAHLALEVLSRYRKAPAFASTLERLRDLCRRGDHLQRSRSIEALTEFRDRFAVDALVGLLGTRPETIAEEARQALVVLTCQDFRQSERRWRAWYADHGQEARTRWLIDALLHKNVELRKLAQGELLQITGQSFGYEAQAPRREREAAAKTWLDWWRVQGAHSWP